MMTAFLALVTRFFDLLLRPFSALAPVWGLLAVSVVTGLLMLVIFRYTSNQKAIRTVKDRLKAHLLALWLFQDQLPVVFRTQGRLLRVSLVYTKHTLVPLAVMLVPLVLVMAQLEVRYGQAPIRPGETFLLTATLASDSGEPAHRPAGGQQASLHLPAGLAAVAPPVHIAGLKEITWKLEALAAGTQTVELEIAGEKFSKQVVVAQSVAVLSPRRTLNGFLDTLLNPTELKLPASAPVEEIAVSYPAREIVVGSWHMHWLIPFFVFSLLAALAFKGVLKTEF